MMRLAPRARTAPLHDGSGRLQTVCRRTNPRYYRLIEAFRDLTGVPMVLNTSFNENEPVVCEPQEALDCFVRTRMDVLVMGSIFVERKVIHPDRQDWNPAIGLNSAKSSAPTTSISPHLSHA